VVALERCSIRCDISGGGDGLEHHECDGELKLPGMQVKSRDASNWRTVRKGLPAADARTCRFLALSSAVAGLAATGSTASSRIQRSTVSKSPSALPPFPPARSMPPPTCPSNSHRHAPARTEKRERPTERTRRALSGTIGRGIRRRRALSGIIGRRRLPSYTWSSIKVYQQQMIGRHTYKRTSRTSLPQGSNRTAKTKKDDVDSCIRLIYTNNAYTVATGSSTVASGCEEWALTSVCFR
jgi:hypothetical protein